MYEKGFRVGNTVCMLKYTKGDNYAKSVGGVTLPFSPHYLMTHYICTKFQEIIFKGNMEKIASLPNTFIGQLDVSKSRYCLRICPPIYNVVFGNHPRNYLRCQNGVYWPCVNN